MLGRRSYTKQGLRERLGERFSANEVEAAVERLDELGLVDDRAYAERFVRDRFGRAGYGPHRIRRDLLRKGVGAADADAAIASLVSAAEERRSAIDVLDRFRRRRSHVASRQAREESGRDPRPDDAQAEYRHLIGKGFSASLVRDLLNVSL